MDVLWARPGKNPSLLSSFDRRVPQKIMYRIRPTSPSASSTSFYSHSPRAVLRRGWAQPNYRQFIHRRDDCCSRTSRPLCPRCCSLISGWFIRPQWQSVQLPTISQISTMAESRTSSRSLRLTVELQDAQNANWTLDSDSLLRTIVMARIGPGIHTYFTSKLLSIIDLVIDSLTGVQSHSDSMVITFLEEGKSMCLSQV